MSAKEVIANNATEKNTIDPRQAEFSLNTISAAKISKLNSYSLATECSCAFSEILNRDKTKISIQRNLFMSTLFRFIYYAKVNIKLL